MGFRTVVVKNRSKLDLKMNYLVCRNSEETKIYIPEISYLILESTAISITTALLSELTKNNVKIIFCDEKHNPESELVNYYANYNCVNNINAQIMWNGKLKQIVWQKIIQNKIFQQRQFLFDLKLPEYDLLDSYIPNVLPNDKTNREGHAAKVYFNALFGNGFQRRDMSFINKALNYGYSVLLSCFTREIVRQGYLTQLGIWHKNEYNYFNLASDLMEPFRILIDKIVYGLEDNDIDYKIKILEIFNLQVTIDNKKQFLENAITIYCQHIFDALNNQDIERIIFYE